MEFYGGWWFRIYYQPAAYNLYSWHNALDAYYDKGRQYDDAYEKMKSDMQPSADAAAKIVYNGFIAQEVEATAKKLN